MGTLVGMIVVKFGGTSVGAVPQIDRAARIVESMRESHPVVVVSAMAGVTDGLLQAGESAVAGQVRQRDDTLWEIRSKHDQAINELFKDRSTAVALQDTEQQIWEEIQIWTDVNGVMTADPRIVPDARVLERVSYKEAAEMSYFGAKVLHPQTIMPAVDENIPIRIKNTFAPDMPGTLITAESPVHLHSVKTVTSITGVTLVSVEGRGMIGVPGVAGRVFTTTARNRISVLMFSQGSSEQHISLVVNRQDGENTVKALRREFETEIERRRIDRISSISDIAIIALVGEGIKGVPGVAARAFGVLGSANINILMIAQGSSELNLSIVVRQKDAPRVVQLIHGGFELNK